jgi:uncharacterized membrane protein
MSGQGKGWLERLPHPRHLLFVGVLAVALWPLSRLSNPEGAIIVAFDLAALAFILSCVPLWLRGGPEIIRRQAQRDDVGQVWLLLLAGLVSAVVLAVLVSLIMDRNQFGWRGLAVLVATLMASWTFVNLSCAFHYAHLYYSAREGHDRRGLAFPGDTPPGFSDFVNFAFVIGMTCQTADIGITDPHMRRISTLHGLFAFAFNLGVLALAVNVLASSG